MSFSLLFILLCVFVLGQGCAVASYGGQNSEGVASLPACNLQGSNAGCQAWWKALLSVEPLLLSQSVVMDVRLRILGFPL